MERRVERDVVVTLAVEERDVLGFRARFRVRQRVEPPRAHLGQKISLSRQQRPRIAAEVAEVDDERLLRLLAKDVLCTPQLASIHRLRLQVRRGDQRLEVVGIDPDEDGVERRLQRVAAAEDPDLSPFGRGRGVKADRAFSEEHEAGDAEIDVGNEDRPFGERQVDVLGGNLQIARRKRLRRIERQPIDILDRRQPFLVGDRPFAIGAGLTGAPDVEPPRGNPRARAKAGEDVDQKPIAALRRAAGQRLAIALLQRDVRGARHQLGAREIAGARTVGAVGEQREIRARVTRLHHALHAPEQQRDAVVLLRAGRRARQHEPQQRNGDPNLHGHTVFAETLILDTGRRRRDAAAEKKNREVVGKTRVVGVPLDGAHDGGADFGQALAMA